MQNLKFKSRLVPVSWKKVLEPTVKTRTVVSMSAMKIQRSSRSPLKCEHHFRRFWDILLTLATRPSTSEGTTAMNAIPDTGHEVGWRKGFGNVVVGSRSIHLLYDCRIPASTEEQNG